jgi:trans-2,3-dihydro-3-hydroxyanthranilate isomerase
MNYEFYQVDVFTNKVFGGNPLAVFPKADGMDEFLMQKIAREMNLSETTFVFPPISKDHEFDIRIYTPEKEIPFGGHPMIGTAHVLQLAGKIDKICDNIRLGTKIGSIEISLVNGVYMMKQPLPSFKPCKYSIKQLSDALSLNVTDIDERWVPQIVSTGFPAIFLPLKSQELLAKIKLNLSLLENILSETNMIYAFALGKIDSFAAIHSRSFAPFVGIYEDPATGSAGGALGAYLVKNKAISKDYFTKINIKQGYEMGRPSNILVTVGESEGEISSINVGGNSKMVIKGQLAI